MTSFLSKEWAEIESFFEQAESEALKILKASIDAVVADIKANGLDAVKAAVAATAAAVVAAKAAGKTNSEIGQAGLAVLETAAVGEATALGKDAVAAAKGVLSADSAHAVVTAQVAAV